MRVQGAILKGDQLSSVTGQLLRRMSDCDLLAKTSEFPYVEPTAKGEEIIDSFLNFGNVRIDTITLKKSVFISGVEVTGTRKVGETIREVEYDFLITAPDELACVGVRTGKVYRPRPEKARIARYDDGWRLVN